MIPASLASTRAATIAAVPLSAVPLSAVLIAALLLVAPLVAQDLDQTLKHFAGFTEETRNSLIRGIERRIKLDPNPAIQRVVSMQRDIAPPVASAAPHHRAAQWAKGVAPTRKWIATGTSAHTKMRARYPTRPLLPDLIKGVYYDWGRGKIVRRREPLADREVLANLFHGYPPGSDAALARLLAKFDNDTKMRGIADYLSHLYADLNAKVYESITLYEAWYSGEIIDVPDVDAIPFERLILKTRRFKSPIPANNKRTQLYARIRDAAFAFRKYRTLREAAAAAFFRAEPKMDPTYAPLVPRFHYLFVVLDDDPDEVASVLRGIQSRDAFVTEVDKRLKGSSVEFEKRLTRKKHLADMQAWLCYWVRLAVYEQMKKERGK